MGESPGAQGERQDRLGAARAHRRLLHARPVRGVHPCNGEGFASRYVGGLAPDLAVGAAS